MNEEIIIRGGIDEFSLPYISVNVICPSTNKRSILVKAVIDTGATGNFIKESFAQCFGIKEENRSSFKHPTDGDISTLTYRTNILIDEKYLVTFNNVGIIHTVDYPADVIIGMSFLKYCDLTYMGFLRTFSLSLPESYLAKDQR